MRPVTFLAPLLLLAAPAYAQQPVQTQPWAVNGPQTGGTITTGGTFQSAAAAEPNRKGCLVQNTSARTLYVFFGATASATTANSFQVAPGGSISCNPGGTVLTANIAVTTSTTSDTYVIAVQ